ncbi:metallophosphoesterase [Hamadaea tsunoensis]|uniref:metallophosphoesterase n=1 Tax=Hamadaea tsunoensis TaxID=53368 RepID=UPI00048A1D9F|nr:metallophosphoesterase [Hamadaea tsunoensis]
MIIAHVSDTHLDGGPRALRRTRLVFEHLRRCAVDVVLVTGDLADHGTADEYAAVRAELVADVPVLMLPGNHDDRAAYRTALLGGSGDAPINQAVRVGGALFALCDSTVPGQAYGVLGAATLDWLRTVLAGADCPVLIGLHHHPIPLHNPLVDGIGLRDADDFAAVVRDSPAVAAILCGHAHAGAAGTFAGRPLLAAPGVVSTTRLPWTTGETLTWANTADLDGPPGVAFHVLTPGGDITTHFRTVQE